MEKRSPTDGDLGPQGIGSLVCSLVKDWRMCVFEPVVPTGAEKRLMMTGVQMTLSGGCKRDDIALCARRASNPYFFAYPI